MVEFHHPQMGWVIVCGSVSAALERRSGNMRRVIRHGGKMYILRMLGNLFDNFARWLLFAPLMVEGDPIGQMIKTESPADARAEDRDAYLEYSDHGLKQLVDLPEGTISVGSSRRADCVIASPKISGKQLEITRNGNNYSVKNLSGNGSISVNGERLPKGGKSDIQYGTVIYVCGLKMKFLKWSA